MSDEPRKPLDYATPRPARRCSRTAAAILAYLFSSYAAGIGYLVVGAINHSGWPNYGFIALLVATLLDPLLFPPAFMLAGLRGSPGFLDSLWAGAFITRFVLAFRHLRRPRGA